MGWRELFLLSPLNEKGCAAQSTRTVPCVCFDWIELLIRSFRHRQMAICPGGHHFVGAGLFICLTVFGRSTSAAFFTWYWTITETLRFDGSSGCSGKRRR